MVRRVARAAAASILLVSMLGGRDRLAAQDTLTMARDLYASAAYEDALAVLNRLRNADHTVDDGRAIEQYRAFCLLALGRSAEADAAIEAAVAAAPFAQPSESDCSPRVRAAFRDVRRRALPAVIEREYAGAKAAFDRKDPTAGEGFKRVLALIADPDLKGADLPKLSDLRTLANDFLVLSTPKAAPAPPQPLPAQPVTAPPPVAPASSDPTRVYAPEDANVVPPFPVYQSFAPMKDIFALRPGVVEIIIDELGEVVYAATKVSVNAVYDRFAISTAKTWRYRPAVRNGVAVKYRMAVQIPLQRRY